MINNVVPENILHNTAPVDVVLASEHLSRIAELQSQVDSLSNELVTARGFSGIVQRDARAYKMNVGNTLRDHFDGEELTTEVRELFKELDIEDYLPTKTYTVNVTVTSTSWVEIEATSEDEARNLFNNGDFGRDIYNEFDWYDMNIEIDSIEES